MKMYHSKLIFFLIFSFLFISLVISAPNPRLGEIIENTNSIVDLATCYEQEVEDSTGLTFEEYLNIGVISEDCKSTIDSLEIAYQEQLEYEPGIIIKEGIPDSDGDKFNDEEEIEFGTNINDPNDFPWWIDVDGDGFTNEDELFENVDPLDKEEIPIFKDELPKNKFPWLIYLAIALTIMLIVILAIYFIYYDKEK